MGKKKNKNKTSDANKPSKFQIWKLASRPHTLTASIVPVIVGYALTIQLIRDNSKLLISQRFLSCAFGSHGSEEDTNNDTGTCSNIVHEDITSISLYNFDIGILALQFGIFACLIQISTNLHNDYADFVKGADNDDRVGQARATQRGWLTPYETCRGCVLCMLSALLVGIGMIFINGYGLIPPSNEQQRNCIDDGTEYYDPFMIFIVLSSLFNAVAYTGGPFPLGYIGLGNISIGYSGLGDLFVFLYFGIVATLGVPYLYLTKVACFSFKSQKQHLLEMLYSSLLHSIPIGFLATAIIVVNNLRDRHTDIKAGKKTMAVRFGSKFAKIEYLILVVGSYGFCIYFWLVERRREEYGLSNNAYLTLLPLLSFPLAIPQLKAVSFGGKDGQALNDHVGGTAQVQMIYCILMASGLMYSTVAG